MFIVKFVGKIGSEYVLQDLEGNQQKFTKDNLKQAITCGALNITNLKLSKDGKVVHIKDKDVTVECILNIMIDATNKEGIRKLFIDNAKDIFDINAYSLIHSVEGINAVMISNRIMSIKLLFKVSASFVKNFKLLWSNYLEDFLILGTYKDYISVQTAKINKIILK